MMINACVCIKAFANCVLNIYFPTGIFRALYYNKVFLVFCPFSSREALATVSNKENKIFMHKFIFYETYMLVSTENER